MTHKFSSRIIRQRFRKLSLEKQLVRKEEREKEKQPHWIVMIQVQKP